VGVARGSEVIINTILRLLLTPIRFIFFIPEMVTTFLLGLIIAIPLIGFIYVVVMTVIWLPFYGFISGTSWLYKKVPVLGFPLALIGIPVVIIINTFLQLMPNPDRKDKYNKAAICDSFPLSMPSQLVGQLITD
jgi:hypothetical protein